MNQVALQTNPIQYKNMIDEYVNTYFIESKNTVISTVRIAKIVLDIFNKYSTNDIQKSDFDYFCRQVNLDPASSQFRKYLCIANKADRIEQFIDDMPSAVSVIYQITTLEPEKFEELVESNELNRNLTLSKLNSLFPKNKEHKKATEISVTQSDIIVSIKFNENESNASIVNTVSEIRELIKKNNSCSIKLLINSDEI